MSLSVHPGVRACPHCRLTFPSPAALRRHDRLDHRPAPDGAWLTSRCLGTSREGDGAVRPDDRRDRQVPNGAATSVLGLRLLPLLALVLVAALVVVLGPLLVLSVAVMTWGHWARWHGGPRRAGAGPPGSRTPDSGRA